MEELEFRTAQLGSAGRWAAGDVGVTENEEFQLLRITHIYIYIWGIYIFMEYISQSNNQIITKHCG